MWAVRSHFRLLICQIFAVASLLAHEAVAAPAQPSMPPAQYLAIRGGVSLGSYESGVNWALVNASKPTSDGGPKLDRSPLRSFSGASAGAINALLSAVDYCSNTSSTAIDNIYYSTWDVGLQDLLKSSESTEGGVFSRKALRDRIRGVETYISQAQFRPCRVYVTFSVTRFVPQSVRLLGGAVTAYRMRFVFSLEAYTEEGRLRFRNHTISDPGAIYLPEDSKQRVAFQDVTVAALASSAFPVAFSPVSIDYCHSTPCTGNVVQTAQFSDGGLFDNAPVGVANILRLSDGSTENPVVVTYIDPDIGRGVGRDGYRHWESPTPGLGEYIQYFGEAMNSASSRLYWDALSAMSEKDIALTTRRYPLVADYDHHFAAFYAQDFRRHDYLVGLYDGLVARQLIAHPGKDIESLERTIAEECDRFGHLQQVGEIGPANPVGPAGETWSGAGAFLKYLHRCEFQKTCELTDAEARGNRWLSIQRAIRAASGPHGYQAQGGLADFLAQLQVEAKKGTTFADDMGEILGQGREWQGRQFTLMLDRLESMQESAPESTNRGYTDALKASRPIVDSLVSYGAREYWPLSGNGGSFYYGWDWRESAQLGTYRWRYDMPGRLSVDVPISYHYLSSDRESSHYLTLGAMLDYHHNSFTFSTIEAGVEGAPALEHRNPDLINSRVIYAFRVGVGLLGDLVHLDGTYRPNQGKLPEGRAEYQMYVQFDVCRLYKMMQ